jgi:hypothetical protein
MLSELYPFDDPDAAASPEPSRVGEGLVGRSSAVSTNFLPHLSDGRITGTVSPAGLDTGRVERASQNPTPKQEELTEPTGPIGWGGVDPIMQVRESHCLRAFSRSSLPFFLGAKPCRAHLCKATTYRY